MLFAPYSRGVAVGHGMVFIGTVDGRGIALDQKTGKEKWQVQLTDFANCHGCNFTSPPVVAGDMLTFGSTAGELATQGKIFGVEAATGKKVWEFNTIKEDPKSWPGESGKYGGGGAWMPGTMTPKTDTVFYGTGNPGKDFVASEREGDNLYTDSVVALDPKTGKLKWYRQEIPHDVWDFDSPYEVMLFKKDGKDLIVHLNKSGYVFVLDKNERKHREHLADQRPQELREGHRSEDRRVDRPCRTADEQGDADLPVHFRRAQLEFGCLQSEDRPLVQQRARFLRLPQAGRAEGGPQGLRHRSYRLERFRPAGDGARRPQARPAQRQRSASQASANGRYEMDVPGFACVLTTGGGLVFNGDPMGMLQAFDAETGKVLWSFNTGSGMRGGIVSYAVDGEQYILVPSGWGSYAAILLPALFPQLEKVPAASTLIAFKLSK